MGRRPRGGRGLGGWSGRPPTPGERLLATFQGAARREGAYLVPLRVFVGLGWLRACAEKLTDPGWRDGAALTAFLSGQLAAGAVAVPPYAWAIEHLFLPSAGALGLLVVLGQLVAGLGIGFGAMTNAALLGGLFMNANFLLAGAPNPSAFYVVIQVVLLLAHAGAVIGLDARLAEAIRSPWLVARPIGDRARREGRAGVLGGAALAVLVAAYALRHVTDWTPAGSVEDPAMVLAILAGLAAAWATIAALRAGGGTPPLGRDGTAGDGGAGTVRRPALPAARAPRPSAIVRLGAAVRRRIAAPATDSGHPVRRDGRLSVTFAVGWSAGVWETDPLPGGPADGEQRGDFRHNAAGQDRILEPGREPVADRARPSRRSVERHEPGWPMPHRHPEESAP